MNVVKRIALVLLVSLSFHCGDDDSVADAGEDTSTDTGTEDTAVDVSSDVSTDVATDVSTDAPDAGPIVVPDFVEIVRPLELTDEARIPENDPNYVSAEIEDDRVVLEYSAAPTIPIMTGHVIVGGTGEGYMRKVVTAALSGTTLTVTTTPAEIQDVFAEGRFRVTSEPESDAWVDVDDDTAGSRAPLGGSVSFIPTVTVDELVGCGAGFSDEIRITPIFAMRPEFIFEVDIRRSGLLPRLVAAEFQLGGEIEVGYQIGGGVSVSGACMFSLLSAIFGSAVPSKSFTQSFVVAVGPIPVPVTLVHKLTPVLNVQAGVSASIDTFEQTASMVFGVSAGATFAEADGWSAIWDPRRSSMATLGRFEAGDDVTFSFGASIGIEDEVKIYGAAGPTIGVTADATRELEYVSEDCAYSDTIDVGLTGTISAAVEIERGFVNISVASAELARSTPPLNVYSMTGTVDALCVLPPDPDPIYECCDLFNTCPEGEAKQFCADIPPEDIPCVPVAACSCEGGRACPPQPFDSADPGAMIIPGSCDPETMGCSF